MHKLINEWIQEIEFKINSHKSEDKYHDLSDKRARLEKLKGIKKEVLAQSDMFSRFEAKLKDVPENAKQSYLPAFTKFEDLKKALDNDIASLENLSHEHETYTKEYNEVCNILNKARADLQQFTEYNGEKQDVVKKLNDLKEFHGNLTDIDKRIQQAKVLGQNAMETTTPDGKDQIKSECRRLQTEIDSLTLHSQDAQRNIANCIDNWDSFEKAYELISESLGASEAKLKADPETENSTPADSERGKVSWSESA